MSKAELENPGEAQSAPSWRIKVGFVLFIVGLIAIPLLVAILALIGGTRFAAVSGGLLVAGEIMLVAGAAIAGKQGYAYIKATVFGFIKKFGPPQKVGKIRYRFGLLIFFIPVVYGWALPYFGKHIPGHSTHSILYGVIADVMLGVGLFLLGGDFWDKLRSLFVHEATVVVPGKPGTAG
jgi:hypothetical protein